ncbi:MAG: hypothetical protein AB7U81_11000 [Thiohalomonadaceae bacterium]
MKKGLMTAALLGAMVCAPVAHGSTGEGEDKAPLQGPERYGVKVEALRLTAAGYLLDLRLRVIDPKLAAPLFERTTKPTVELSDGVKLMVPVSPKIGAMRQSTRTPEAGREYFAMFANAGRYVKAGQKVNVVFGKHRLEGIEVR